MFVDFAELPRLAGIADATQMGAASRLVEQGWDVCRTYLDSWADMPLKDRSDELAEEIAQAVATLPERSVVLTAGVPLRQRDPLRFVCHNSATMGSGAVSVPYWYDDLSQDVPFFQRAHLAGFQGAVASNPDLRGRVVSGFAGCDRGYCCVNSVYFFALSPEERAPLRDSYWEHLSQTQFSLCPRGDDCGSVRLFESLAAGCIPVVLADGSDLPLSGILPWDDMIVRVPEADAHNWQAHIAYWRSQRTDGDLAALSQHNRQTARDWLHWTQLGKILHVERVARAIAAAERGESKLSPEVLALPGMSSGKVRHLLNNLAARRYLEVGVWKGATFAAACDGRRLESATAVDNFSGFQDGPGGERRFLEQIRPLIPDQPLTLHSLSFFDLPEAQLPRGIDLYFYDGDHSPAAQRQAIVQAWPALADLAVIVIDDINMPGVLDATQQGLAAVGANVLHEWLLPARFNGDTEQWWNGLYVAAVHKSTPALM